MALIQMKRHQNSGCALISTNKSVFIDLDVSVEYDQISRQVSAHVRKFELSLKLHCSKVRGEILAAAHR